MASEEDRLEALLNAARKQLGEDVEEESGSAEPQEAERAESMPSFKDIARDFEESEMADAMEEMSMSDPADEYAPDAADTASEEAPAEESPAAADPNAMMSDDDIAALFAAMDGGDDVLSEAAAAGDAALEEAPAEETKTAEEITAPVNEEVMTQPMEDGTHKNMSQSEIEALLADGGALDDTSASNVASFEADASASSDTSALDGLGLDDIEARMAAAEAAGLESDISLQGDDAFDKIMENLGEDDLDLSDIGDMIEKSDSGELLDPAIAEDKGVEAPSLDDDGEEAAAEEDKKKKPARKKKEKKAKASKENADDTGKKEKKPGLFSKLIAALFTEEEESDEAMIPEAGSTKLSDENAAILSEIDAEDKKGKPKKEKKKKEKKPKEEKPKKEKKPKPQKEKKPAEPDDSKHIPKKYISRTVLLSASIMIALVLVGTILPGLMNMSDARKAYYEKDYKSAFLTMYGKDLNESDKILYQRSRLLVMLDRKYESYEHYMNMGNEQDALDALLQGLKRYEDLLPQIQALEVEQEALAIRLKMLDALSSVFGLGEAEAMETLKYSAADYTGKIGAVISGQSYTPMQEQIFNEYGLEFEEDEEPVPEESGDVLPDLLPEEQQYLDGLNGQEPEAVELPAESPSETLFFQDGNINIEIESDQF